MLCSKPLKLAAGEFGCGQCLPCRINRSRMWTARLVLEGAVHRGQSLFFTLTYAKEFLPEGGTLVPGDLEAFRYKLRYAIGPYRYYFVGEYGERRFRPHYHGIVFGWFPVDTYVDEEGRLRSRLLDKCWPQGVHHCGSLSIDSGAYCAGYVTKKMTHKSDERLHGRHPEFSRMSRKPGLGAEALDGIIEWLYSRAGAAYIAETGDVPQVVRFNGKIFPLGRYLVGKLRAEFGLQELNRTSGMRALARRLEGYLPEVVVMRNLKREGHAQRALFFEKLRRDKERI